MSKCLRISRAYSLRWMKRNPTLLLIAFLIGIITIIFHLYAFKHEHKPRYIPRIGDFDYTPGAFLKGLQPSENTSYCEFNYGLPEKLKWGTFHVHKSPEPVGPNHHGVIYDAIKGTAYSNHSEVDAVTYATQATPEYIYHIVEVARYWNGPISLAVFVPDYDLYIAMQIMNHLCHCYSGMSKVSLHLFYPMESPPKIPSQTETRVTQAMSTIEPTRNISQVLQERKDKYRQLNANTRPGYIEWVRKNKIERMMKHMFKIPSMPTLRFNDCAGLDSFDIPIYRKKKHMFYPINVGRNVARNASWTNYFIVSDIEMVPSTGLATKFLRLLRNLMGRKKRKEGCIFAKTIFVVPLFEVERGEELPRDKETLTAMVAAKRANYFHAKICPHCQRFPGLQSWLDKSPPHEVEPMMIVRREYPYHRWEPLYFGTQMEPWYSEVLVWEGLQDKMAQMLELCLQRYRLIILDGAFLSHAATTPKEARFHKAVKMNNHWYQKIVAGLKLKYPDRPPCKLFWGTYLASLPSGNKTFVLKIVKKERRLIMWNITESN